jgi:hypothetical protein
MFIYILVRAVLAELDVVTRCGLSTFLGVAGILTGLLGV